MAVQPQPRWEFNARVCMQPSLRKILRGMLFTMIMGIPTVFAIQQGVTVNVAFVVGLFIIGALLVFGIDIEKVKFGSLTIWFSEPPDTYEKTVEVEEEREE